MNEFSDFWVMNTFCNLTGGLLNFGSATTTSFCSGENFASVVITHNKTCLTRL
jgi:hypothetical protein